MRLAEALVCTLFISLLIWMNMIGGDGAAYGGLPWLGWVSLFLAIVFVGLTVILNDSARAYGFFAAKDKQAAPKTEIRTLTEAELAELGTDKYRGPSYPHPVIFPDRCIGCQACVDACPHDVLAIVDGVAAAVAPDLCMEDTACQAECPVNPKACIVINTSKPVVSRPAPTRDGASYETNVPGCYIVGDVSGVPLIKNAVKEGYEVIQHIARNLKGSAPEPKADYDVAIVGIGPAGASAAACAQELGLKYVAIEQDKTLSTIDAYPKGKYIFFKPDTKEWSGGLPISGLGLSGSGYASSRAQVDGRVAGDQRENILSVWLNSLKQKSVKVNEFESCKSVRRADDGDYFAIETETRDDKASHKYRVRRVVLAIGLRGAPNRLRLPNEEMKIRINGRDEQKVLYSLTNPAEFRGRRIVVVGGGNVAVEAAVDLVATRKGSTIEPRSPDAMNHVTLLVRTFLAPTVKFGNKFQLYKCADDGILDLRFGVGIKEMREHEVVLENVATGEIIETIPNDYVFALIGGERPDRFLQSIGITLT